MEPGTELSRVTFEIFSKLEEKWLSGCDYKKLWFSEPEKTRILSIDGGGIKGIIAGEALVHLEEQLQVQSGDLDARIADFFDAVAGTGIGGVLAAMLLADNGNGRPILTAKEAVKIVKEKSSEIFKPVGFFRRRLSGKNFDRLLMNLFSRNGRALTLTDTLKPLLIPCYDLNTSAPFVFSRADASQSPSFNFELWRACRATSATPNLFRPFRLKSVDGKTACTAIDGGLVMSNPSAAAVTHVLHNKRDFPSVSGIEDLLVLSLGNGPFQIPSAGIRRWTSGHCSKPVVEIVLDGVSQTVDQILGNAFCWNRSHYVRIQANGFVTGKTKPSMDDASVDGVRTAVAAAERMLRENGVESLPFGGKRLLTETNGQRLEKFAEVIVASRKAPPPSPSKNCAVNGPANGR